MMAKIFPLLRAVSAILSASEAFTKNINDAFYLNAGTYIIKARASGDWGANCYLQLLDITSTTSILENIYKDDKTITLNDTKKMCLRIVFNSGVNVTGLTIYPMIRPAGTSPDYVPHSESVMGEIEDVWAANAYMGAHNLCKIYGTFPKESSGVTATKNADESVTFSGSATAYASFYFCRLDILDIKKSYKVSGLSGTTNMAWGNTYVYTANGTELANITSPNNANDRVMSFSAYPTASYVLFEVKRLNNGAVSGTMYPLITIEDDTSTTYQPYAMTNRELTTKVTLNNYKSDIDIKTQTAYEVLANKIYQCKKDGNLVTMNLEIKSLTEDAAPAGRNWVRIFDLPTAIQPKEVVYFMAVASQESANVMQIWVNTDGVVTARGGSVNAQYYISMIYAV